MENKILRFLFFCLFFFVCCHKKIKSENKKEIEIKIDSFFVNKDTIMKLCFINNTDKDYFINVYDKKYSKTNLWDTIDNSTKLEPIIFDENNQNINFDIIDFESCKRIKNYKNLYDKKLLLDDSILEDEVFNLKHLKVLKRNSIYVSDIFFKKLEDYISYKYEYLFDKNEDYFYKFNYQMKKEFVDKYLDKRKVDSLRKLNILPYYGKIESNVAPIIQ